MKEEDMYTRRQLLNGWVTGMGHHASRHLECTSGSATCNNSGLQRLAEKCCKANVDDIIIQDKDTWDFYKDCVSILEALRHSHMGRSREK